MCACVSVCGRVLSMYVCACVWSAVREVMFKYTLLVSLWLWVKPARGRSLEGYWAKRMAMKRTMHVPSRIHGCGREMSAL